MFAGDGYRFWAARVAPGASRRSKEGPERLRRSQERPRRSSGMSVLRVGKIGNLSLRVRLAASEGGKIAQIGSLARWKRIFPAILG